MLSKPGGMGKRIIYQGIYIVLNATGEEGLKINELCIQFKKMKSNNKSKERRAKEIIMIK